MNRARAGLHIIVAVSAACALAPAAAAAQAQVDESRWSLEGSHDSFCIWYLAEPALAIKVAGIKVELASASSMEATLPGIMRRVVRDEPKFAKWIPATICIGFYDRITVDGRVVAQARNGRRVIVATNAFAAHSANGIPGAEYLLLDLFTDQRALVSAAKGIGFDMRDIEILIRNRAEDGNADVSTKLDGAMIVHTGHPTGEGSVGTTRTMSFGYAGLRKSRWSIQANVTPSLVRPMVGALRVEGKSSFAKALKSSPIREVGPAEEGGTSIWVFRRWSATGTGGN